MDKKGTLSRAARAARTELAIRAARPDDRVALAAIAAQIWDGEDYLPQVFDQWLADPYGGFFVAELHGRVVGAAKISRLSEGEWWLQGLRVDPAFQGQGIGRIMHHFLTHRVRQYGIGEVRFSTASTTQAVHRLAKETGFQRELVCMVLHAPALDEPPRGWRLMETDALPQVWAWLQRSPHFEKARRSLEWNWTFYRITQQLLQKRLVDRLVYGWKETPNAALAGVLLLNPSDPADRAAALKIGYLDTEDATLSEAAHDTRRLAAALGQERVRVKPPKSRWPAFDRAGFTQEWEGEIWLYARDVVLTENADVLNKWGRRTKQEEQ